MDQLDRRILSALLGDARRPLSQLAKELGAAPATVHQRVKRLTATGIIRGARLDLDWTEVGLPVLGLVSVAISGSRSLAAVADELAAIPFVETCYAVTGEFDLTVEVRGRSSDHLGELLEQIRAIAGAPSRTVVVLSTFYEGRPLPLDQT